MNIAFCYLGFDNQVDYLMSLLSGCFERSFHKDVLCLNLTNREGRFSYRCRSEESTESDRLCFLNCGDVETYWGRLMLREADLCVLVVPENCGCRLEKYLEKPLLRKHQIIYTFVDYPEPVFHNRYHLEESNCCMIPLNAEFTQFYERGELRKRILTRQYHPSLTNELLYKSVWQLSFQITRIAERICSEQREDLYYERSF